MRLYLIICAGLLTGCGDAPRVVYAPPSVPADLRQPVAASCLPPVTERDVAACLFRKADGLDLANARIVAIDDILTQAEGAR